MECDSWIARVKLQSGGYGYGSGTHSLTAIYESLVTFLTHPLSVRYAFYVVYEAVWLLLRPFSSGGSVDMAV